MQNNDYNADKGSVFTLIFLLLMFAWMIYMATHNGNDKKEREQEIKQAFMREKTLLCSTSSFINAQKILLSKSKGWSLYQENRVIKGDLVMELGACQIDSLRGGR